MIVLIDNYDSFTFNLFHYLGGLGADVVVHRNDKISAADVMASEPDAIVLSPGPCTPNEAGICLDLIEQGLADHSDPRRLPRSSGDRPGLRRQSGARDADARQAVGHQSHEHRRVSRHQRAVQGDALSFAGGRARQHAGRTDRQCRDRRSSGDGADARKPAGARRAIPSREHRLRARPSDAEEFSRPRRRMERATRPQAERGSGAQIARSTRFEARAHGRRFQSAHRQGRDRGEPDARRKPPPPSTA